MGDMGANAQAIAAQVAARSLRTATMRTATGEGMGMGGWVLEWMMGRDWMESGGNGYERSTATMLERPTKSQTWPA